MSIKDFISKGWLATYQYYSIPTNSEIIKSIESIREFDIDGDYKHSALVEVFDTTKIRAQLYNSYAKNAYEKKGIIYSISREHSEHICAQYRSHNISIENIDSETPSKTREDIIKAFKNGDVDIIVNVDIFSEGFDCPDIEFIQLARPTKSLVKYIQQVGRGLRKNGTKQCVILDNVGMYSRFGLPDEDRDWEAYFYGNGIDEVPSKRQAHGPRIIKDYKETDLSEGDEEMPEDEVETEEGFFIVNIRNDNRMFLINVKTMYGGSIVVIKGSDKKSFTIIKTLSTSTRHVGSSYIIGTISKIGLLSKFTAFDKSKVNITITV